MLREGLSHVLKEGPERWPKSHRVPEAAQEAGAELGGCPGPSRPGVGALTPSRGHHFTDKGHQLQPWSRLDEVGRRAASLRGSGEDWLLSPEKATLSFPSVSAPTLKIPSLNPPCRLAPSKDTHDTPCTLYSGLWGQASTFSLGGPLSPQEGLVGEERPSTCLAGPPGEPRPELAARATGAEQRGVTVLTLGDGTGACGVCPSGTHTPYSNEEPWVPNVAKPTGPSISRVGGQREGPSHSSTGEGRVQPLEEPEGLGEPESAGTGNQPQGPHLHGTQGDRDPEGGT